MSLRDTYEEIMANDRLPSPSAVVLEVIRLTESPETSAQELAGAISADPAICARVIRAVNAASMGIRGPVASIEQALAILGYRAVARIAVAFSVVEQNRSGLAEFDYDGYWSESLARAVSARELARRRKRIPPDEAFTYGLLSNIGRLALVSVYGSMYQTVLLTLGTSDPLELDEAERAVFDVDCEMLSAFMMREWGMPSLYQGVVENDGKDVASGHGASELWKTCRVASSLARVLVKSEVQRDELRHVTQQVARLGVAAEGVSDLFAAVVDGYREAGASLAVPTIAMPSLAELYVHAAPHPEAPPCA